MYSYRKIYEESNGALYVCNWQLQTCENVLTQSYRVIWEIEGLFGFLLVRTRRTRARWPRAPSLSPARGHARHSAPLCTRITGHPFYKYLLVLVRSSAQKCCQKVQNINLKYVCAEENVALIFLRHHFLFNHFFLWPLINLIHFYDMLQEDLSRVTTSS